MRSIERTVLAWILGALTLGAMVIVLVTYLVALEEMHDVLDDNLKNVAEAVASYHQAGHSLGGNDLIVAPQRNDAPEDDEIVTLTWTPQGRRVFASDPRVQLPFTHTEGLTRPSVQGEGWVVYSSVSEGGVAQAAQRNSTRNDMAGESAARVVPPLIALVVAVGGLLLFGLRRGLQPLDSAAQDVAQRSAQSLEPITLEDVPKEIKPLVRSINDLMNRLAVALATQRRFLADAAHELRTPITALRLQLQLLQRSGNDAQREQAVAALAAGIDRSQRLVEQLLQVARSDPDGEFTHREPVDLAELVRTTVSALSTKAEHQGLDLGADAPETVMVQGDVSQLTVLLNNLVENALRYTPAGGVVDVAAGFHDERPLLRVVDNGPGIAESERDRVFDRFYRCEAAQSQAGDGSGSGLGLSIVRTIAERHGAQVSLATPAAGHGLEVRVLFPSA